MNVQLPARMGKTAFLDWVQGRGERYELDRGRVMMMTGGSRAHWQITFNLAKALDARLDPDGWCCRSSASVSSPTRSASRMSSWILPVGLARI